jgi:uncharacterized protein YfdQ (DUF2303 family)
MLLLLLLLRQVGAVEEVAAEALQEMVERRLHRWAWAGMLQGLL